LFVLASLVLTLKETLRYRGAIGQWSWVLHRLTGLGVVLFLFLHVIDTSWAVTNPEGYVAAIASYQSPLFTLGEFGLVFAVVYHALNGLRIVVFDFKPEWWKHQQKAALYVLAGTVLVLLPYFIVMLMDVFDHYGSSPTIMPIDQVLIHQLPFGMYFVGGLIAAGTLAFLLSAIRINVKDDAGKVKVGKKGGEANRNIEKFWWSFMRISGVLIIPLVLGHLAMMHVLQGVFDLTLQGSPVIGTAIVENLAEEDALVVLDSDINTAEGVANATILIPNGINESGTSVEFVAERWNFLWNGMAIWKLYDIALLVLAVMHGFNGLRLVLTDYTMDNTLARRTVTFLTLIGGAALIFVGAQALWLSINPTSIQMAIEATRALGGH
jgi:succinate dehydrogenase / fumarate reductase, cytochrome b subunit